MKEKVNRTLEVVFDNKGVIVGGETTLILIYGVPRSSTAESSVISSGAVSSKLLRPPLPVVLLYQFVKEDSR